MTCACVEITDTFEAAGHEGNGGCEGVAVDTVGWRELEGVRGEKLQLLSLLICTRDTFIMPKAPRSVINVPPIE